VRFFSPLQERQGTGLFFRRAFSRMFSGRKILPNRDPGVIRQYARQIARELRTKPVDVIVSNGTIPVALLDCAAPIVFWCDATFAGMVDFYPGFTNLQRESLENGDRMEQAALSRAALAIYASEWAAGTCLEHYRVDPTKIEVVPFGPNLAKERAVEEIEALIRARSLQTCRLAFSGIDWQRKGVDLALDLAGALNRAGLRTELAIIGCRPPQDRDLPDYVEVAGYVNTSTPAGSEAYESRLARAHFLVLPTRADCSPRVIYEANALGVPAITSRVGALPAMVRRDVNGAAFPADGGFVQAAADYILGVMRTEAAYAGLAARTVRYHKENHTWEKSARRIVGLLEKLCPPSS
jgi:glycosyltransferase involved in cell wall biosynthesis